jgi:hypothetical protein
MKSAAQRLGPTPIITRPQSPSRKTKPHASGRVNDDVRQSSLLKNSLPFKNLTNLLKCGAFLIGIVVGQGQRCWKILSLFLK